MLTELQNALHEYVYDTENPEKCYALARIYDSLNQAASSVTFYLKCAERTQNTELAYECLIRVAAGFDFSKNRDNTTRGILRQAIMLLPRRPEAYFLLARSYERARLYLDCYTYANLALEFCDFDLAPLRNSVGYPGKYGLIFEKAVAAWWWGREMESRALFRYLSDNHYNEMDEIHKTAVFNNLVNIGIGPVTLTHKHYDQSKFQKLRYKFNGAQELRTSHGQVYQDLFVLSMLNGKRNGTYLEIGSAGPFYGNNTALLEQEFDWTGVGIDFDEKFVTEYRNSRKNQILHHNALTVDYNALLAKLAVNGVVDYLQLDCEPTNITYEIMTKIPFDKYKFAVITYEHDHYVDRTKSYRQKSRDFLKSKGYRLVVNDVSPEGGSSFEDWWVHPDLIDAGVLQIMESVDDKVKNIEDYMFPPEESYLNKDFDWGLMDAEYRSLFARENFVERTYERHYLVQEGDIVVDVGANCGAFSYSILDKKPKKIYAIEPSNTLINALKNNLKDAPAVVINKAISSSDSSANKNAEGVYVYHHDGDVYDTMTFKQFIADNGIDKIDFLKFDCEGGEYDIFTEENHDWIKRNVKHFSGEWHIVNHPNSVELFIKFRDLYLNRNDFEFKIYERCGRDVTHIISDNQYIKDFENWWRPTYHGQFIIHAKNKKLCNVDSSDYKPWEVTKQPTLEFTTNIAESGCVVDCLFCPQRTLEKSYSGTRLLTFDNYKTILNKIPRNIRIAFSGLTEPFLNKNCTDMILYAHERGHEVVVFTTGVGMTPSDVHRLKNIPFAGGVNGGFVLHLPDEQRIAKHPINKNYIEVIKAFKEVSSQIKNFYVMCMGDVHSSVKEYFPTAHIPEFWNRAGNLIGEFSMKPEMAEYIDRVKHSPKAKDPRTCGCYEDLYHNEILPNGDVLLCCMDYSLSTVLGNLYAQEYYELAPMNNQCFEICRSCENGVAPKI